MENQTIDINGFCNERCEFCYQNLDGSVLPEQKIYEIADQHPYSRTVEIGGGEPFLDSRIVRILTNLRKRGKRVHVSTNATTIPKGLLELEDRVRDGVQIQVSLHASNPELYTRITKRDLFDRVIENTKKIKQRFSTVVSSAVYQENVTDVPHIVNLAYDLGLPIRINLVFPVGNGRNVELLTPDQVNQLRGYLLLEKIKKGTMIESPLIHQNNCTALQNAYGIQKQGSCPVDCGLKRYVSPKGRQYNCEFLRMEGEGGVQ